MTFADFEFEYELQDSLDAMRFSTPTPVQEQTIPVIMNGKDIIACAQTGTGKTAAYLLPTINRIVREPHKGIDTVVLVPTRELALQIDQQMEGFGYYVQVSSVAVYGGNDSAEWNRQKNAIVEGADILIATPGRLLQHVSMGYVDFSTVRSVILDEADRMLDMGFYDDIMQVIKQMPVEGRQTHMFSATMPPKIRDMAKAILQNPEEVNIAISKPAEGVKQGAYVVYEPQKAAVIRNILEGRAEQSIIVFSTRKQTVKELARELKRSGYNADVIHSDLEQKEREEALLKFRNRQTNILVATDIIA
ncbi:MAG: DEAD/DEAH box helicase, partial [Bacteroidia bacterium]|nr:DEAD/DEAH box helicase [Bacteroidia bacterium]